MAIKPKLNQSLTEHSIFKYYNDRQSKRDTIPEVDRVSYDLETQDNFLKLSMHLGVIKDGIAKRSVAISNHKAMKELEAIKASRAIPIVVMSHALVTSVHELEFHEKRLMSLAFSKINPEYNPEYNYLKPIKVTVKEYCEVYKTDQNYAYRKLKQAAESILTRRIIWKNKALNAEVALQRWVTSIEYRSRKKSGVSAQSEDDAHVLLFIPEAIVEQLQFIRGTRYVIYPLHEFAKLESEYGQRLYENLKNFRNTGFRRFGTEDFCRIMEVPASYLREDGKPKDFGNIKNRVIKPAILDIKKIFSVNLALGKRGSAVTYIDFTFKKEGAETKKKPSNKQLQKEIDLKDIKNAHRLNDLAKKKEARVSKMAPSGE